MVPEHKNTTSRRKFKHLSAFGQCQSTVGRKRIPIPPKQA
jgi:hypothetical protein